MKTTFKPIVAVDFVESPYKVAGQKSVMIQQKVVNTYGQDGTNLNTLSLVTPRADLVFEQTRTLIMRCDENATLEQIQAQINGYNLYKMISSHPIITQGQQYRISTGELDPATIEQRQIIPQLSETERDERGNKKAIVDANGNKVPLLDKLGRRQYRMFFIAPEGKNDVDMREKTPIPTVAVMHDEEPEQHDTTPVDDYQTI